MIQAIKSSDQECLTYINIINSCSRFQIASKKRKMLLPCIYMKPDDDIKKSVNGKMKGNVQKLLKSFHQVSELILRAAELIGIKNWK